MDTVALFPDTNILLHYPALAQIDWKAICPGSSVKLVICLQVIAELDEKKSDPLLGKRANRAIKEIQDLRQPGRQVQEGVALNVFNEQLRSSEFPDSLSPDSKDDRILHLVRMYSQRNPSERIAVVTEDFGMDLRCEAHGIKVYRLDRATRLPSPQDEQTKKYQRAIEELNSLKNRLPAFNLRAVHGDEQPSSTTPSSFVLNKTWQRLNEDEELAKVYAAYPKHLVRQDDLRSAWAMPDTHVSDEAWKRYNQELDNFLLNYRFYLQQLNAWAETKSRTILFDLWLGNAGNAPAEDVDLYLMIPPQVKWVAAAKTDRAKPLVRPEPPKPPEKPKVRLLSDYGLNSMLAGIEPVPAQIRRMLADRDRNITVDVWGEPEKDTVVHAKIKRIKHNQSVRVGKFLAVFGDWGDVKSFQGLYTITTTELSDKVTGSVPFIVSVKE